MTVETTIARCPRCGRVVTVYIRSDDGTDLVCLSPSCREGDPSASKPQRWSPITLPAGRDR